MVIKRGDILYEAWINIEADLNEKSKVETCEHHVRTINKNGIYLTEKVMLITWGRRSKKHGDFGWLPAIPKEYVIHFRSQEDFDRRNTGRYHKSKSAAYRSVLAEARKYKRDATRILTQVEKAIEKHKKK